MCEPLIFTPTCTPCADLGPVQTGLEVMSTVSSKMPLVLSVLALCGMAFGVFTYRKILLKSFFGILSKLTRRRR